MEIFLSWSGDYSRQFADATKDLIDLLLPSCKPWMSSTGIESGERWSDAIAQRLENTNYGIVFLTPDNLQSSWLHFEAGALAKSIEDSRLVPLLLGVDHTSVVGPLTQFQGRKFNKENVKRLFSELNEASNEPRPQQIFEKTFEQNWEEYSDSIVELQKEISLAPDQKNPDRDVNDVLEELVKDVRNIRAVVAQEDEFRIRRNDADRSDLTYVMLAIDKLRLAIETSSGTRTNIRPAFASRGGLGGGLDRMGLFGDLKAKDDPDEK